MQIRAQKYAEMLYTGNNIALEEKHREAALWMMVTMMGMRMRMGMKDEDEDDDDDDDEKKNNDKHKKNNV